MRRSVILRRAQIRQPRGKRNMAVTRIKAGPRMSQAVVNGKIAYLAGQVAANPVPSVGKQTKQILGEIDKLLKAAGTSKKHLLTANIWLTDMRTFGEMNEVWDAWVDPQNTPARATVEAKLARPDLLVEVMVTAAIP
jgi:enamine deaminase RidA (YjgF/YER057c/UK114 family)